MAYRPPFTDPNSIMVSAPHPSTLDKVVLMKQCELRFGRVSGPGGQHRNKNETASWIVHVPTGIEAKGAERREREVNKVVALKRLRLKLATKVRATTSRDHHEPSELWRGRRQGTRIAVNPGHDDYPSLLSEALDVIVARRWDVAGSAKVLGVSMSQLSRLVHHHPAAFAMMNKGRESVGLPALRK